jgi:hypothetical protein
MNALSSLLPSSSTATAQRITNIGAFNKLIDAVSDPDLYESDGEPKPQLGLIRHAADILSGVSLEGAEVAPFYGEIDVTWKANGIRVKATFGPDPVLFYVYRECFENGRVAYSHMQENADPAYLQESLQWLANPLQNV